MSLYRQPVQSDMYWPVQWSVVCGVCTTGTGQSEASLRGVTAETGTLISPLSLSLSERRDEKGRARLNIVSRVRGDG